MTNSVATYDGTVDKTDDGGWIRFERRLGYRIDEVWDAVTNPERLADWWLPFPAEITVDLQEGGEMVFAATSGEPPPFSCTILRVEAPTLLEHTHMEPGSYMRWELEPVGDECLLRLSTFVSDPDAAIGMCFVVGLHTSLARLDLHLAGQPTPWDEIFDPAPAAYAAAGLAPAP
jgi:uncharacterized protein YndB with AHSA1/START domain